MVFKFLYCIYNKKTRILPLFLILSQFPIFRFSYKGMLTWNSLKYFTPDVIFFVNFITWLIRCNSWETCSNKGRYWFNSLSEIEYSRTVQKVTTRV